MEKNKKTDSPAEIDKLKTMVEYMKKVEAYKNKTIRGKDKKKRICITSNTTGISTNV